VDLSTIVQFAPFIAVGAFLAVLGMAYAIAVFLNPERTARDRVSDMTGGSSRTGPDSLFLQEDGAGEMARRISALAAPKQESEQEAQRRQLLQAGFRNHSALEIYSAIRVVLALSLAVVGYLVTSQLQVVFIALGVLVGASIGYYAPFVIVKNRVTNRKSRLLKPFPDALDLLVSSVEAGLGLDAAFQRIAKEMESAAPELAHELQQVNYEVQAGIPRVDALRRLDHRTGLEEVNALVNVLLQAERFGTSVASALRIHSELVRKRRMLAAEENAAQISPKLTVAMIVFVLPSLFIVLAGPAGINMVRTLFPAMAQ
jgi:tight adherence protein C